MSACAIQVMKFYDVVHNVLDCIALHVVKKEITSHKPLLNHASEVDIVSVPMPQNSISLMRAIYEDQAILKKMGFFFRSHFLAGSHPTA
jgi:hypothetical protein